ncbi:PadR family transcriptional regulator [Microvirga guangxiensis]|uniref:DNA-binding transcriptional regulator, PadR family n=1 Tax=Microvirga guangxiensis TaxID=549386 RepID=A0A1G5BPN0_9HYPH|nr:PadR family transcriptional regulator [Microvirga guangxiensis]SCX91860.1 DNA-binding transcriptional regulator, PadR family [Microvirga guangxiensis]
MDTKTLCLAVLSMGDASGYEIKKRVEEVFSRFIDVAPSGIYAALKLLDQEGLVSAKVVPQEGRPNKTVYTLLEAGREALTTSLRASEGRHKIRSELVTLLMFADLLPPEKLRDVLANRMLELKQVRMEMEASTGASRPGHRFLVRMGMALVNAELAFLNESVPAFLAELSGGANKQHKQKTADLVDSELS